MVCQNSRGEMAVFSLCQLPVAIRSPPGTLHGIRLWRSWAGRSRKSAGEAMAEMEKMAAQFRRCRLRMDRAFLRGEECRRAAPALYAISC